MGINDIFKTKIEEKPVIKKKHTFSDADRLRGKIKRDNISSFKRKIEQKQNELLLLDLEIQKREKLKAIKEVDTNFEYDDVDYEEDEPDIPDLDNPDALLTNLLTNALLSSQNKKNTSINTQIPNEKISPSSSYSDDDLIKMVNSLPDDLISKAKLLTDKDLRAIIAAKAPQASEQNIERIVTLIKARN